MKKDHSMKTNRLTLSFSGEDRYLEQNFLDEYKERVSRYNLWSIILGLFFYSIFAILDAVLLPEKKYILWFIRFALVSPILIIFIISSFFSFFQKVAQIYVFVSLILAGSGISLMVALAPSPASSSYYAGVILVFMLGYGFTRIRFIWASLAGWINVLVYEIIAIFVVQTPAPILINNNFFFISANIIGMFSCYAAEYYTRRDFYLSILLENEQDKVKQLNLDLEKKVDERTLEIMNINEALRKEINAKIESDKQKEKLREQLAHTQKMESIGQLAGGIAHDFNNQLTGILGNAELLTLKLKDAKLKGFAENICIGAVNGAKLSQQLLSFARKGQYEQDIINLEDIIEEVVGILEHTIDKGISILHKDNGGELTILGDHHQIQNAFLNIAINSRDALSGSGIIIFESSHINVDEYNRDKFYNLKQGQYVCTSITDDGCGMTNEVKKRIFEPFFTTKDIGKGTGMGLSAAYGAIKYHGGEIYIETEQGVETTFSVFLPYSRSMEKADSEKKVLSFSRENANILIVDDDEIICNMIDEFLNKMGYTLHFEKDGVAGSEYYSEYSDKIDLVIIDMIMPKKNGENLYYELLENNPHVKVLFISGKSHEDPRISRMINVGVPFLQKPFSLIDLSDSIAGILK